MIDTQELERIITLAIYTGYVRHEKPVSLLIIAKPETGKTQTMLKYMHTKGLAYLTDCTAYGITRDLLPKIKSGEVRHLLIPDLVKPLSRSGKTVMNFITFANALVEEGIIRLSSFATMEDFKVPVKCGIIGAVIKEDLEKKLEYWGTIGFMSRFIPFSYNYSIGSVNKIFQYIVNGDYMTEKSVKLKLSRGDKHIKMTRHFGERLIPLAQSIGEKQRLFGFRALRDLKTLTKACALSKGKNKVTKSDIDEIYRLGKWFNLSYNPLE